MQQHSSDPSTANVRLYPDRDLGRTLVDEEWRLLIGRELPGPGGTYCHPVSFGNEAEIPRPLPSGEMSSDERHRFRGSGVRLAPRDRHEISKNSQINLR